MKYLVTIILTTSISVSIGQNILLNSDFEVLDTCPVSLGQVYLAENWRSVIMDADYYNCGLYSTSYPSDQTAFSGTGYMGFATYGDSLGSAEAIGQNLTSFLLPFTEYSIVIYSKKTNSGSYSQNCGGIAVYGLVDTLPLDTFSIHSSQLPASQLLTISDTIRDTTWSQYSLTFTPSDTMKSIIFTISQSPSCEQCIFIDGLDLQISSGIKQLKNKNNLIIFPNPANSYIKLFTVSAIYSGIIYNHLGQQVDIIPNFNTSHKINISNLSSGVYYISIKTDKYTSATYYSFIKY